MPVIQCNQCGYAIPDPSRPCPSCGAEVPVSAASRMYANDYSLRSQEKPLVAVGKTSLMASICRITAILLFIGSIIAGFNMRGLFLYVWLSGFITCLFIYAMGEIIDQQAIGIYNAAVSYINIKQQNEKIISILSNKQ